LVAARHGRAFLQPCLHDEPQAYFPQVEELFRRADKILFNSEGERQLAGKLYGPGIHSRSVIVGEGIELTKFSPVQFEATLPAELRAARFVLYLGRRDATKNVDLLARAFARFKSEAPYSDWRLVLAGPGNESFAAATEGLIDLGLVDEALKAALLKHCAALFQPSRRESFSRAMMEAWSAGRPVAAHRACLATAAAIEACAGGWLADAETEWATLFSLVAESDPRMLDEIGARGRAYALEQADWERVIARYEEVLGLTAAACEPEPETRKSQLTAVHQLLPDFVYGDAISNEAVSLRSLLRAAGYESHIFAKRVEPRVAHEARLLDESQPKARDGLLYHHSIGSEVTTHAVEHPGPKCLIYHNVTPAEFFAPYRPGFAWMLETGRAQLPRLARHFPVSVGDSAFNAAELAACGFRDPGVLPIVVDPSKWNIRADEELMNRLQDGKTNLLFVGRIAPNKRQDELVKAFAHYLVLDSNARLILAGDGRDSDPYYQHLRQTIAQLDLTARVIVTGQLSDAELLAYYRTARLYWSLSEHEGFGVPLVEAMWFDVPVLAYRSTAVPATLGDAGVMFTSKNDLRQIAALANLLAQNSDVRRQTLAAQASRRLKFTPEAVQSSLSQLLQRVEDSQQQQQREVSQH
ncbi:MAG: glycosyltransferase, partial [Acidobacteria bacterium]|nr:glycosyltransferase [Acidobacteriota bacterium]